MRNEGAIKYKKNQRLDQILEEIDSRNRDYLGLYDFVKRCQQNMNVRSNINKKLEVALFFIVVLDVQIKSIITGDCFVEVRRLEV